MRCETDRCCSTLPHVSSPSFLIERWKPFPCLVPPLPPFWGTRRVSVLSVSLSSPRRLFPRKPACERSPAAPSPRNLATHVLCAHTTPHPSRRLPVPPFALPRSFLHPCPASSSAHRLVLFVARICALPQRPLPPLSCPRVAETIRVSGIPAGASHSLLAWEFPSLACLWGLHSFHTRQPVPTPTRVLGAVRRLRLFLYTDDRPPHNERRSEHEKKERRAPARHAEAKGTTKRGEQSAGGQQDVPNGGARTKAGCRKNPANHDW